MAVVRVLSVRGDDSFEYDPTVEDERLDKARAVFHAKLGKGYLAFVPDEAKRGGTQIRHFDPTATEIILQPAIAGG
jgi:hypothetical protein